MCWLIGTQEEGLWPKGAPHPYVSGGIILTVPEFYGGEWQNLRPIGWFCASIVMVRELNTSSSTVLLLKRLIFHSYFSISMVCKYNHRKIMCYSCLKYVLEFQESCETKRNEKDKLSYPEGYVN